MVSELQSEADPSVAKLQLREELKCSLRTNNGKPFMLIEDPLRSQFFRLGINDWRIVRLFDGKQTLRQVLKLAVERYGEQNVETSEVMRLANWLVQVGLAEVVQGSLKPAEGSLPETPARRWHEPLNKTAQLGRWNPLFLTIQLPNPQPLLKWIYPWMTGIFSQSFFAVWLFVCAWGVSSVFQEWTRFRSSLTDVFAAENWLYLLILWVALKVVHECGHAVACIRYGGSVTRCGLMLILFSPIAWVDVTSAWSFRSKWKRIFVSAAGMYIEFFIAAVAAIIWARTSDPAVATLTRNIVLTASLTTLLFNMNFLMRFDGYFILADLLDIQNLYSTGQQFTQYLGRRYLLGMRVTPPSFSGTKWLLIRVYGIGILVWRYVFLFGIVIVAAQMFQGAGLLLALFSVFCWFVIPLMRFCLMVWHGNGTGQLDRKRLGYVFAGGLVAAMLLLVMPWPGSTNAPGVVEFSPLQSMRVDTPGFVQQVLVLPGATVQAGQPLVELRNDDVVRELNDIDLQVKTEQIRLRVLQRDNQLAQCTACEKKLESLCEQREQLAEKVDALTIKAPISGQVIAHDLQSLLGSYVKSGRELLAVGSTGDKEVRVSIEQVDVDAFRKMTSKNVSLYISGHRLTSREATLDRVYPRATRRVIHHGLSATSGGQLAVQQNSDANSDGEMQLVEPHFEGVVHVPKELSDTLHAGEVGHISLGRGHESVYRRLWSLARGYLERKTSGA